ncbi:putative dipeptide transport system permease protein (plasmid) [Sinorhizobium fredii HH103]|uniref:Dipeptide transport system permease protein n=1 Tax=Sinorhizobium fredii (strain HH103) TaxID=1117943 RepID=G9AJ77_SINF1|nr:ABC transporter permease [Sinorhizobium fredii]CCF01109.1 putative dipeptide transport system permease protein [Sinorhizobium fredii HH103]
MLQFVIKRLLYSIPVLLGVSIVVFAAVQFTPGDVAQSLLGFAATAEKVAELRQELGLDQPIYIQYANWLINLMQLDFGTSVAMRGPVAEILGTKIVNSLILTGVTLALVVVASFVLATFSGSRFRSKFDRMIVFGTLILASLPVFWLGIALLYVFGVQFRLFPMSGMYNMASPGGFWDLMHHAALPAVATAASSIAVVTRITRSSLIDCLNQPYILAARARGLSRNRVIYKHGVRSILPTFANVSGLQIGYVFGNAVFTEIIFNWPGVGLQLYDAILIRDIPMVQGCVLVVALVFVVGNLLSDTIVYGLDTTRR